MKNVTDCLRIRSSNSDLINLIKIKNISTFLKDISFVKSIGGMYYKNLEADLPQGSTILSCTFAGWTSIRETDNLQAYIASNSETIGIMSNVNVFSENAHVIIRIAYIAV